MFQRHRFWWEVHIVSLRIPPPTGDLRDLLWHQYVRPSMRSRSIWPGDPLGVSEVTQSLTPTRHIHRAIFSCTMSAGWTPQPTSGTPPEMMGPGLGVYVSCKPFFSTCLNSTNQKDDFCFCFFGSFLDYNRIVSAIRLQWTKLWPACAAEEVASHSACCVYATK